MILYKVLAQDGKPCHGGTGEWDLPTQKDGQWIPGDWMPEIEGKLVPCENGYHLCRRQDLIHWLHETIYEAEYDGESIISDDKIVVRKVRLLRQLTEWTEKTARLFACDCAAQVLPIFEEKHPDDKRPRMAIETARKYANGEATKQELDASSAAAYSAAASSAAAYSAAAYSAAAYSAAASSAAAYSAAAYSAAASSAAAYSAAASSAADAAYFAAAYSAAADADERNWQTDHLFEMLGEN